MHSLIARLAIVMAAALPMLAPQPGKAQGTRYRATNLVADLPGRARVTDPNLVNPWGVAFAPGGPFWINDNGTGLSTLYDGTGAKVPVNFTIPPPAGAAGPAKPTGMIFNATRGFLVPGTSLPAVFVFSTEDGTISAWAPNLPSKPLDARLAADNSKTGAIYKGMEFGVSSRGTFLYATNFHSARIDVFGSNFAPANAQLPGGFTDPGIPVGYAPFGIRNIDGNLFVTFAKQNGGDDEPGLGHGYVDIFDTDGHLIRRFVSAGLLNSPWGVTRAPEGFGQFANSILIGNFGDGLIHGYRPDGTAIDAMRDASGLPLRTSGLWGLYFGGAARSNPVTLFFTAGTGHEAHGLFGSIVPIPAR